MGNLIEQKLRQFPSAIITEGELACLLKGSANSRYARSKRAVQAGDLIRIKRGLYVVNKQLALQSPNLFELAQRIYGPSYISLESALAYHGLIPEAVYAITSAVIKRPKAFTTPLGNFTYLTLPTFNFFMGVAYLEVNSNHYLIATPWKALLDYIYCYKKKYSRLIEVEEDLRLDTAELPNISAQEIKMLDDYYQNKQITKFINNLDLE